MTKYFDKDFWRFFMGFVAIICTSLIILLATRLYQNDAFAGPENQQGNAIMSVENN
jgi:predicted ferric reductase